jgi:hypothetical protein
MSFSNYIKDIVKFDKIIGENSYSSYKINSKPNNQSIEEKKTRNNRILTPSAHGIENRNKLLKGMSQREYIGEINENIDPKNEFNNYSFIYNNIILILNDVINDYLNNNDKLCQILNSIFNYIYDIKFGKNKRKIIKSANKTKITQLQIFDSYSSGLNKRNKGKLSSKKNKITQRINSSIERYHINEFNYLIYINELHKKISDLEKDVKINSSRQISDKDKIKMKYHINYDKVYSDKKLKIRSQSFTIKSKNNIEKNHNVLKIKKNKFKIGLKDIFTDFDYENNKIPSGIKMFEDKKYLISHPRLNFNGYINNNNGRLSNIINEKLNKLPKETFHVKIRTKLQKNKNSNSYLSFNPIKFKIEGIRSNKNIDGLRY